MIMQDYMPTRDRLMNFGAIVYQKNKMATKNKLKTALNLIVYAIETIAFAAFLVTAIALPSLIFILINK